MSAELKYIQTRNATTSLRVQTAWLIGHDRALRNDPRRIPNQPPRYWRTATTVAFLQLSESYGRLHAAYARAGFIPRD